MRARVDAAHEKRMKEQRLRLEMQQAKKDVEAYMSRVDEAKDIAQMEERKLQHGAQAAVDSERQKVRATGLYGDASPCLTHRGVAVRW
jgi:hypothetical protein